MVPVSEIMDCTRQGFLTEQEQQQALDDDWQQCRRRREWPGYENLMKAKISKGG